MKRMREAAVVAAVVAEVAAAAVTVVAASPVPDPRRRAGFPRVAGSVPADNVAHRAAMESAVAERGLRAGRRSGRRA